MPVQRYCAPTMFDPPASRRGVEGAGPGTPIETPALARPADRIDVDAVAVGPAPGPAGGIRPASRGRR